ncbi:MAG: FKBP-type peptidyl-prolyl cis-trans isomerase [Marinifilaceae bacterium]|jgi:FKBP-type peptidyl-prolyl cis-trans isomerase SlyD|nr:FKBP-type peptidyl-prolyl cis-trans isomerase [Marinifilaceae bacterium]
MTISKNKMVSVTYILRTEENGEIVEQAVKETPLTFICGTGQMLEKFEENLLNLNQGDNFKFKIECEEAYGQSREDAVVDLPKDIFVVEGKFDDEIIKVGEVVPMQDASGNRLPGLVLEIADETVKMDFNHPMADDDLYFEGEVIEVRDATAEELSAAHGGGCSGDCGGGCSSCD